ncbi:hypothetical protein PTTG_30058, partial [Puccinia triticina 1-1 BBBD Race 1]
MHSIPQRPSTPYPFQNSTPARLNPHCNFVGHPIPVSPPTPVVGRGALFLPLLLLLGVGLPFMVAAAPAEVAAVVEDVVVGVAVVCFVVIPPTLTARRFVEVVMFLVTR